VNFFSLEFYYTWISTSPDAFSNVSDGNIASGLGNNNFGSSLLFSIVHIDVKLVNIRKAFILLNVRKTFILNS